MSEKSSGVSSVRNEISIVAGPRGWGDTRESWLGRVPRRVPTVTFRTVKALWYGEISNPNHWAARDIKRAAELIQARNEAAALASQYQTIIGGLRATDEDFYRAEIDRLERIARELGAADRSGVEG
ncbi:hypothetical protein [Afipia carboxidovorans]|uniref:hypothetical protein n=1 Tax=Afipia carboxidovorans TaxID=40137 RepID=UPI00308E5875|nr:hypothetical protein CRBSH125_35030 [Afipia carboxidovorans]